MTAVPDGTPDGIPDDEQFAGQETVWMPKSELDGHLRGALAGALPDGATFGFNFEGDRAWVIVSKPGDTRQVLQAARTALGRA
ncbi:hypothetical protein [Actinomadura opuntiae]|uniref:hypothetical protein n=1 Tax=Actinomadura sp. OS1-43 TaxID=604315 RepID=UPI00255AD95A|nr:hypothetical protein [Actinomadura sp. OS1-43]MDL4813094.1 hypothetical protein [Actinomadura sp. OS1-43]